MILKFAPKPEVSLAAQLIRNTLKEGLYPAQGSAKQVSQKSWAQITKELNITGGPKDLSRKIDYYLYGRKKLK